MKKLLRHPVLEQSGNKNTDFQKMLYMSILMVLIKKVNKFNKLD